MTRTDGNALGLAHVGERALGGILSIAALAVDVLHDIGRVADLLVVRWVGLGAVHRAC